jgi:hypothetical protein
MKKLLQECGAVFKMPESVEDGIPFDDPEIRRDYMELQARAWAKGKVLAGGKEGSGDE